MKAILIFANGTEEIEGLTPVDVLRRANAICDIVSISDKCVTGSHGIKIIADKTLDEIKEDEYDAIIIPGGMLGANNISKDKRVIEIIKKFDKENKLVASICASPSVVLAKNSIYKNRKLTCFPSKELIEEIEKNNEYNNEDVIVDKNLITANGPKSSLKFSLEICKYFNLESRI